MAEELEDTSSASRADGVGSICIATVIDGRSIDANLRTFAVVRAFTEVNALASSIQAAPLANLQAKLSS